MVTNDSSAQDDLSTPNRSRDMVKYDKNKDTQGAKMGVANYLINQLRYRSETCFRPT